MGTYDFFLSHKISFKQLGYGFVSSVCMNDVLQNND